MNKNVLKHYNKIQSKKVVKRTVTGKRLSNMQYQWSHLNNFHINDSILATMFFRVDVCYHHISLSFEPFIDFTEDSGVKYLSAILTI